MRHRVVGKKLGRDCAHRKALLKNLSESLIINGSVTTTLSKAKYVRPYIEKLVTRAKADAGFNSVKYVKGKLITEKAVRRLFSDVAPKFVQRSSGYTRIVRVGNRVGDNALMARIEFVEDVSKKPEKVKSSVSKEKVGSIAKPLKKVRKTLQKADKVKKEKVVNESE